MRFKQLLISGVIFSLIFQPTQTWAQIRPIQKGLVSYYGCEACKYNKTKDCKTASGSSLYKLIKSRTYYAASWEYPFGTRLRVYNPKTEKSIQVIVLDRGPAKRLNRLLDIAPYAFKQIADLKEGVFEGQIQVVQ